MHYVNDPNNDGGTLLLSSDELDVWHARGLLTEAEYREALRCKLSIWRLK